MLECWARVTWDNGGVVEEIEEATAVFREKDLFLSALDDGCEMDVVGFFELLAGLDEWWFSVCLSMVSGLRGLRCWSVVPLQRDFVLQLGRAPARGSRAWCFVVLCT